MMFNRVEHRVESFTNLFNWLQPKTVYIVRKLVFRSQSKIRDHEYGVACRSSKFHFIIVSTSSTSNWKSSLSTELDPDVALQDLLSLIGPDAIISKIWQYQTCQFTVSTASKHLPKANQLLSLVGGGIIGPDIKVDAWNLPAMSILLRILPKGSRVQILSFNEHFNPLPQEPAFWNQSKHLNNEDRQDQPATNTGDTSCRSPWFLLHPTGPPIPNYGAASHCVAGVLTAFTVFEASGNVAEDLMVFPHWHSYNKACSIVLWNRIKNS